MSPKIGTYPGRKQIQTPGSKSPNPNVQVLVNPSNPPSPKIALDPNKHYFSNNWNKKTNKMKKKKEGEEEGKRKREEEEEEKEGGRKETK